MGGVLSGRCMRKCPGININSSSVSTSANGISGLLLSHALVMLSIPPFSMGVDAPSSTTTSLCFLLLPPIDHQNWVILGD